MLIESQSLPAGAPEMRRPIPGPFSTYLDLLRFVAAVLVVAYHMKSMGFGPAGMLRMLPDIGHKCVIIFFVLSGYVIASAVYGREKTLGDYVLDRAARVFSVVIPTLILSTIVAYMLGMATRSENLIAALLNLTFLGQSWSLNVTPAADPAYWSLCYEVIYYALFGCTIYLRGVARIISILTIGLLAAPKVLLLLPCWLLGVAAFRWRDRFVLSTRMAYLVGFVIPSITFLVMSYYNTGTWLVIWTGAGKDLAFSQDFAKDYLTALLVAPNLYAVRFIKIGWARWVSRAISAGAALTFSLYLVHMPILFAIAVTGLEGTIGGAVIAVTSVGLASWIIGTFMGLVGIICAVAVLGVWPQCERPGCINASLAAQTAPACPTNEDQLIQTVTLPCAILFLLPLPRSDT